MTYDIVIAGGGASGLMAAIAAAEKGVKVAVLEKMSRPARKLRITGKGRCNITNMADIGDFLSHTGPDSRFLYNTFSRFFNIQLIEFLNRLGVRTITERGGRVFPVSGDATEIVDALTERCSQLGVQIICETEADNIICRDGIFKGFSIKGGEPFLSKAGILCTGGLSYPATGSTGDGFVMAENAGLITTARYPALVPLIIKKNHRLPFGLELKNVKLRGFVNNKKMAELFGELTLNESEVTGPLILTFSRMITEELSAGNTVALSIDFKPALEHDILDKRILRDVQSNGKMDLQELMGGLLPSKMVRHFLQYCQLEPGMKCGEMSADGRKKIRMALKDFRFEIAGTRGFNEAIITRGGISLKEIDPKTMESKKIRNLFIAGEVMNLDADTGGYNLQIAFSTGWVAGISAAEKRIGG